MSKKRLTRIISLAFIMLSIVCILYGSIKLARAEGAIPYKQYELNSPKDAVIVENPLLISKEVSQGIIAASLLTLTLGSAGFIFSWKMDDEKLPEEQSKDLQ